MSDVLDRFSVLFLINYGIGVIQEYSSDTVIQSNILIDYYILT